MYVCMYFINPCLSALDFRFTCHQVQYMLHPVESTPLQQLVILISYDNSLKFNKQNIINEIK